MGKTVTLENLPARLSQIRVTEEMKAELEQIAVRLGFQRVADLQRHFLAQGIQRYKAENDQTEEGSAPSPVTTSRSAAPKRTGRGTH